MYRLVPRIRYLGSECAGINRSLDLFRPWWNLLDHPREKFGHGGEKYSIHCPPSLSLPLAPILILLLCPKSIIILHNRVETRVITNNWFEHWIHFHTWKWEILDFGYQILDRSNYFKGKEKEKGEERWKKREENSFIIRFINTGGANLVRAICAKLDREQFARSIPKLDRMCIEEVGEGRGGGRIFVEQGSTRIVDFY